MSSEKRQIQGAIILNYVNMIVGNLIPIFYTPIMLNILGQSEYGLYKLSTSAVSYMSLLSLGLGAAITRYLIQAREQEGREAEAKMLGLFLVIFRIIAALAFIIGACIVVLLDVLYGNSLNNDELFRMRIIVAIMALNTVIGFVQTPYSTAVFAHEKLIFIQVVNLITTIVSPMVNLVALLLGFASIGMAASSLAFTTLIRIIYLVYVRKKLNIKPDYHNMPVYKVKGILLFSVWVFLGQIVDQINNNTDAILIGMVPALSVVGVAIYNIGATFNTIVTNLTVGISNVLTPKINKMVINGTNNDVLTGLTIKVGRIQAYIVSLIITGFIAFGQPFVFWYVGNDYSDSYWVAIILMIPYSIPLVQSLCLSIIIAQNKHKFRSIVYLCVAIVNVVATWIAINSDLGIIGAALMTAISFIVGNGIVINWYYYKKIGINIFKFWKSILKVFIFPILLCVIVVILSRFINFYNILILIVGIIVYTLLCITLQWNFVMNDYEKSILVIPLKKAKKLFKKKIKKSE